MSTLVTGAAGFIGFHTAKKLLDRGEEVVGYDNVNDYYDVNLKKDRLKLLAPYGRFKFVQGNLEDRERVASSFQEHKIDKVIHLAAQAGVRYSLQNPHAYVDSNVTGFLNVLEGCRHHKVKHLVYASTSSVYGLNTDMPFSVHKNVDHPISLYAATKKANELMAHSYSYLYGFPVTGLRFFTVYGPWGRPDMALFLFTKAILEGKPIDIYNNGDMIRDFTYVDDIVEGVVRVADRPPVGDKNWSSQAHDPASSSAPYKIFNIGNHQPVKLLDFIDAIEEALGKKAIRNLMPIQAGDVPATCADVSELIEHTGFKPCTDIRTGVKNFVSWYRAYYKV